MPPTNLFGLGYGTGPAGYGYPSAGSVAPPTISYASPQSWTYGVAISTLSPTTTGATSFAEVGSNLSGIGLAVNSANGDITGVPTDGIASTVATIRATGPGGTADATLTFSSVRLGALFVLANAEYLSKTTPTFAVTNKMTIRASVKPNSNVGVYETIAAWWDTTNGGFLLYRSSVGKLEIYVGAGTANFATGSTVLANGDSHEVVVEYDGTLAAASRVAMWVDGVAETVAISGTIPVTMGAPATPVLYVGWDGVSAHASGSIATIGFSSLAVSGAALTAAHLYTPYDAMLTARKADWFSFYDLKEASGNRTDATGLNNLTDNNTVMSTQLAP